MNARHSRTLISALAVLAFLAIWQIAPSLGWIKVTYVSQPSRVIAAGFETIRGGTLARDVSVSLAEFAAGFALAVAAGIPLGLLLGSSSKLRSFVDPPLMAIYATPYLAIMPILVVWLGIGMQ